MMDEFSNSLTSSFAIRYWLALRGDVDADDDVAITQTTIAKKTAVQRTARQYQGVIARTPRDPSVSAIAREYLVNDMKMPVLETELPESAGR